MYYFGILNNLSYFKYEYVKNIFLNNIEHTYYIESTWQFLTRFKDWFDLV